MIQPSSIQYLDYNATAPLRSSVKSVMQEALDLVGNPSSIHRFGRDVRKRIEDVRAKVADFFASAPSQVIFTSGATEANNTIIRGFKGQVIVSAVEHDSVALAREDARVCPVDSQGIIDLEKLQAMLAETQEPVMFSIMAANNETGVIQPLEAVKDIARKYGAFIHCDAVQAMGKMTIDWQRLDLDAITFSVHKVGGPLGTGGFTIKPSLPILSLMRGGGQERSLRPGTENILGIMGIGATLSALSLDDWKRIMLLRDRMESEIYSFCPEATFFSKAVDRLPNTSNHSMPGVKGETQVMAFDLQGVAISAGSACSSGKVRSSRVLAAMGVSQSLAETATRVSLGWDTPEEAVDAYVSSWKKTFQQTNQGKVA